MYGGAIFNISSIVEDVKIPNVKKIKNSVRKESKKFLKIKQNGKIILYHRKRTSI